MKQKSVTDKLMNLYLTILLISEFISFFIAPFHSNGYNFHFVSEIGFFVFLILSVLNFNKPKGLKTKTNKIGTGINLFFALGQFAWLMYGLTQI